MSINAKCSSATTRPARMLSATAVVATLSLSCATLLAAQEFPNKPPAAAAVKPATLPPFQEAVLSNGVRVVLVENHRNPSVAFRLAIPAGDVYDPKDKDGIARLVAGLLTKGAGKRSADDISAAIESAGGSLTAFTDADFLSVAGSVLSNAAPLAFELLGDVVSRPTFSDKEFELARTQTLSGLQLEASNPAAIATRFFTAGLYGTHPYGRSQTAKSVRAITRGDLLAFHNARVKPRGALLVVAGDINMTALRSLVEKGFAGWTGVAAAPLALPSLPNRTATEIVLVHRPGSVQSNLLVGNLALGAADTLRYSASLANRILGGDSDSRLFVVLREQKSWTYGAYSRITRLRGVGRFEANAEVRTEVTDSALVEMLSQLRKMTTEPIPANELEQAKNALVGAFPLAIETPQQLAERVATVKLYGLARDYLQTYRTRLAAEKVAQVQLAAKRIIKPSQAFIVVVGDGSKIYDKLKAIAPVKIVSVDGDPMTPSDFTPKALGTAFDFSNLVASRDSFVVVMQGRTIGTSVQSVEARSGGWTVRESTNVMNGVMAQQTALETDASLASTSLVQSASMQGQVLKTNVVFAGGRAKGSAMSASQAGPKTVSVDIEIPAGTIDSDAAQVALRLLRWQPDSKYTLNVFNSGTGTVQPMVLTVQGSETVTVPAGTFETWKIEQKSPESSAIIYITKDAARRIVKIAPVGQPIEILLAK